MILALSIRLMLVLEVQPINMLLCHTISVAFVISSHTRIRLSHHTISMPEEAYIGQVVVVIDNVCEIDGSLST